MPKQPTPVIEEERSFYGAKQSHDHVRDFDKESVELSAAEEAAVRERMAAWERALDADKRIVAKYKVEVQFGKDRSSWKPFAGAMSMYVSGSKLNGGGDEKVYWCPREDCGGPVPPIKRYVEEMKDGSAIARVPCPHCKVFWDERALIGEKFFHLAAPDWATAILKAFHALDGNADIYLKYHPMDIRSQTAMELAKKQGGEAIGKARRNRGMHIYPLANIIKDTSNGGDIYKRFLAFIRA